MVLCCGCYSELFDSQREFLAVKAFARAYRFEMSDQKIARFEIRPRKDHRGVDLISDALPFGRLWYDTPDPCNRLCDAQKPFTRCRDFAFIMR